MAQSLNCPRDISTLEEMLNVTSGIQLEFLIKVFKSGEAEKHQLGKVGKYQLSHFLCEESIVARQTNAPNT